MIQYVTPRAFVQTKAKATRKWVDKMIQLAKDGSLHSRRQVIDSGSVIMRRGASTDACFAFDFQLASDPAMS